MMTQVRKHRTPASPRHAAACRGPLDSILNPDLFKALADPTRASLIACIAKCRRPCSVGEVAECTSVDVSVVSRHLALLARSGVLETKKVGRTVFYSARCKYLARSLRILADALEECAPCNDGPCDAKCCCS